MGLKSEDMESKVPGPRMGKPKGEQVDGGHEQAPKNKSWTLQNQSCECTLRDLDIPLRTRGCIGALAKEAGHPGVV